MFALWILGTGLMLLGFVNAEAEGCDPVGCRRGRKGKPGKEGPYGEPGLNGDQGDVGLIGPIGPLSTSMNADLYMVESFEVSGGSYFNFASLNSISDDFTVSTDIDGTSLTFIQPGIFMVSFVLEVLTYGQYRTNVQLELNGEEVLFGHYSFGSYYQQLVGQALIDVTTVGSVLKLKNLATLQVTQAIPDVVSASLNVVRYGEPGLSFVPNL